MTLFSLAYCNIKARPLSSVLSILLLGLGVSIIVLILLITTHLQKEIEKNAQGIDLVIGAKGSPMQIILSNIFQVDFPTGNIGLKESSELTRNRLIKSAIPISLGDSYRGFRIIGTTQAYLEQYKSKFAKGKWTGSKMKAVIGADVANFLKLKVGSDFFSTHGIVETGGGHDDRPFTVSGVLKQTGSVIDKLIIVSLESVWHVHKHDENHTTHADSLHEKIHIPWLGLTISKEQFEKEEITAILIKYASPMAAIRLPQMVNKGSKFQAASPAFETARLFNLIGTGIKIMNILGIIIIFISSISVSIALINSLKERKYELAILRSMGAGKIQIFSLIICEGLILTIFGLGLGFLLAHSGISILGIYVESLNFDGILFLSDEWKVLISGLAIGTISALIPALMTFSSDISRTLSKG